jgi:two-component system sensor histidine kinase ResE
MTLSCGLCIQAAEKWSPILQTAQLQLRTNLPAEPVPVLADPPYLQRLLAIILENASKYTPARGMVALTLEVVGDSACFAISDTGIGIPPTDRSHIFERFRRGSNVQEANDHGSGLGLALAAWIAEHHRTIIEVDSDLGFGSTFSWSLPLTVSCCAESFSEKDLAVKEYLPLAPTQA